MKKKSKILAISPQLLVALIILFLTISSAGAETGLVGYWKMDETSWDGTAGEVIDSSGNNNHGTAKNGTNTSAGGKIGRCGYFDGSDDYVAIGDTDDLSFGNALTDSPFSIFVWVKVNDTTTVPILGKGDAVSANLLEWILSTDGDDKWGLRLYDERGDRSIWRVSNNALTSYEGQWIQLAATYDGNGSNGIKLYLNGNEITSTAGSIGTYIAMHNLAVPVRIGAFLPSCPTYGSYANGLIDDVRIYNRSLSPEEVKTQYETAGLVALWHMNEDSWNGTPLEVLDSSGNGNHGRAYGGATTVDSGKFGTRCGFFNGINGYVDVGSNDFNFGTGDFSIEFWMKANDWSDTEDYRAVISNAKLAGRYWDGIQFSRVGSYWATHYGYTHGALILITKYPSDRGASSFLALQADTWYHVIGLRKNGTITLYLDGVVQNSVISDGDVDTIQNMLIGKNPDSKYPRYFDGAIDEVAIYNRALTEEEIQTHYEEGPPEGQGSVDLYETSGTYVSSVKDAEKSVSWKKIIWEEDANYGEELPNNKGSDSGADMAGNVLLMHLNEESGIIVDYSGKGNNGTTYGGVTYGADGKFNTAIEFDGSNDYIDLGSNDFNFGTGDFSIEFWMKANDWSDTEDYRAVISNAKLAGRYWDGIQFSRVGSYWATHYGYTHGALILITKYPSDRGASSFLALQADTWYHVIGLRKNGTITLYLDGVVQNSVISDGDVDTIQNMLIGKNPDSKYPRYFDGAIDEVAIYNRALSASEVVKHYKRGACNLKFQVRSGSANPPTGDFVGHDGTTDTYFTDASGEDTGINVSNNRYFQYKAYFSTENKRYTPELHSVTITYGSDGGGGGISGAYIYQWEEVFE